jgi:hypothetical protein
VFLDAPDFVWRTLAMLSRLVNDGRGEQLRRIELTDRESLEPGLLSAREALKLCPPVVPQLDVDAVGPTLAEEDNGHWPSLAWWRTEHKR